MHIKLETLEDKFTSAPRITVLQLQTSKSVKGTHHGDLILTEDGPAIMRYQPEAIEGIFDPEPEGMKVDEPQPPQDAQDAQPVQRTSDSEEDEPLANLRGRGRGRGRGRSRSRGQVQAGLE